MTTAISTTSGILASVMTMPEIKNFVYSVVNSFSADTIQTTKQLKAWCDKNLNILPADFNMKTRKTWESLKLLVERYRYQQEQQTRIDASLAEWNELEETPEEDAAACSFPEFNPSEVLEAEEITNEAIAPTEEKKGFCIIVEKEGGDQGRQYSIVGIEALTLEILECFTKAELMDYWMIELKPQIAQCCLSDEQIKADPGVFCGEIRKSWTKKEMIEGVCKAQSTIIKYLLTNSFNRSRSAIATPTLEAEGM